MENTNNNAEQFFDLHVRGVGYLNRVRVVPLRKGKPYLACTIAALRGSTDAPEKTYFDCTVVGEEACTLIDQFATKCEQHKVLIGFKLGDLWQDKFVYQNGPKVGQEGTMLKARLLLVDWVKVDGELVYRRATLEPVTEHPAVPSVSCADAGAVHEAGFSSLNPLI